MAQNLHVYEAYATLLYKESARVHKVEYYTEYRRSHVADVSIRRHWSICILTFSPYVKRLCLPSRASKDQIEASRILIIRIILRIIDEFLGKFTIMVEILNP
jgi:hypothetical protein